MLEQQTMLDAERGHGIGPPGGQTVGVDRDAQALGSASFGKARHLTLHVALEQAHLLHMVEQAPPHLRRARWHRAHQHRLTDPRLEQLDTLRYRRLREAEQLCGALETVLFHHRGERSQKFVIEQSIFLMMD